MGPGGDRLASNSLLEGLVFGRLAAVATRELARKPVPEAPDWQVGAAGPSAEQVVVSQNWGEIRRFMWNYVGIVRTTRQRSSERPPASRIPSYTCATSIGLTRRGSVNRSPSR